MHIRALGTDGLDLFIEAAGNEKTLIADTDVSNAPMAAAFERAGWTRFASRREYVAALQHSSL
jgi:RimJ/RimL family protein N-acetyltransferase